MPKKVVRSKKQQSAENQVKAAKKLGGPFVALAERTRMPVVFSDPHQPNNPIIYANDSFLALTGYSRDEVLGQSYHFLMGPKTDPKARSKQYFVAASARTLTCVTIAKMAPSSGRSFLSVLFSMLMGLCCNTSPLSWI